MKPSTSQDFDIVDKGVRRGAAKALLEHKVAGHSIYISRGGKVVEVHGRHGRKDLNDVRDQRDPERNVVPGNPPGSEGLRRSSNCV